MERAADEYAKIQAPSLKEGVVSLSEGLSTPLPLASTREKKERRGRRNEIGSVTKQLRLRARYA